MVSRRLFSLIRPFYAHAAPTPQPGETRQANRTSHLKEEIEYWIRLDPYQDARARARADASPFSVFASRDNAKDAS